MESKIKEVVNVKEWGEGERKTFYHDLIMENGDKINIGKKKHQQVGWDMTYEITDTSQEFNKANTPKQEGFTPSNNQSTQTNPVNRGSSQSEQILWSVCLKEATAMWSSGEFADVSGISDSKIEGATSVVITLCKSLYNQSKEVLK